MTDAYSRKPRRAMERCDFCGQRVGREDCFIKKSVDAMGWVSVHGIAHRSCAETNATPVKQ